MQFVKLHKKDLLRKWCCQDSRLLDHWVHFALLFATMHSGENYSTTEFTRIVPKLLLCTEIINFWQSIICVQCIVAAFLKLFVKVVILFKLLPLTHLCSQIDQFFKSLSVCKDFENLIFETFFFKVAKLKFLKEMFYVNKYCTWLLIWA